MIEHERRDALVHDFSISAQDELDEREVTRHLLLFHQLSQALGGPVPTERVEITDVSTVLDVACGALCVGMVSIGGGMLPYHKQAEHKKGRIVRGNGEY